MNVDQHLKLFRSRTSSVDHFIEFVERKSTAEDSLLSKDSLVSISLLIVLSSVKYDDLQGIVQKDTQVLEFSTESTHYQDMGIKDAILLVQYTDFIRGTRKEDMTFLGYLAHRKLRQNSPELAPKIDYKSKLHHFIKIFER